MGLVAVPDPIYQECEVCGYSWMSDDPACPSEHCPTNAYKGMLIDWQAFWAREQADEEWLVWPLVPVSRGVALYAPAKQGKSLVALAVVAGAATGRPSLDGVQRPIVETLYLDYEMSLDDLRERLEDLGYGPESDLSHLHYAALPSLPPLNTPEGAKALISLAQHVGAQLVVIDTLGRAVEGDENEPSTVQAFYKWTGLALKAAGIAFLRVDHAGKDLTRGQRGHSSKNDDVDLVWQLTRTESGVTLKCTHRRIDWVPESVNLRVAHDDEGWQFELVQDKQFPDGTKELAALLDRLGVDIDASCAVANAAIKAQASDGKGKRKQLILFAQAWRRAEIPIFTSVNGSRNRSADVVGTHVSEPYQETSDMQDGTSSGTSGNGVRGVGGGLTVSTDTEPPTPAPDLPSEAEVELF